MTDSKNKDFSNPKVLSDITAVLRKAGCVFAEEEANLLIEKASSIETLQAMINQRIVGEPLEYILGYAQFYGMRVLVGPGAFVPRRRTEFLIQEAIKQTHDGDIILDLGCGSGTLATVMATNLNGLKTYAVDIETKSLEYARKNLEPLGGHVYEGDLFEPLPRELKGSINTILANMPYVPTSDIELLPSEARLYEPHGTLDGGIDGLDLHRRVASQANKWLASDGSIFIEVTSKQADEMAALYKKHGLAVRTSYDDELEATTVIATKV